ncbi:hypothetical protein COPCOM_03650 [Coprococcus comes ATCC 27758]|uniref:Uncharacterized protein n=1 Tax=Coprococcus comes ATCC 27758 TaxID=470146 RepID=C0BEN8_9FIRM|nr:hypothetical protein COPCOM_03650 [Coprococcus comes ATCC 27758]
MWCRQYGGSIRYHKKMVRLLLHYLLCNKGFFFCTFLSKESFVA